MKKGFSLIELLITIVIVGLLGAVGYGSYKGQKDKAKGRSVETTLLAVGQAFESCLFLNNDFIHCDTQTELDIILSDNITFTASSDSSDDTTAPTKVCFDVEIKDTTSQKEKGCFDSTSKKVEMEKECSTSHECATPSD